MKRLKKILDKIISLLHKIEDISLVAALAVLILISFSQIVMRNFFATGLFWGDAAGRYLVLWVGLLGAMAATRDDNHISIDIISRYSSEKIKPLIRMITDSATAFICGVLTYSAVVFIRDEMNSGIDAFASVPTWIAGIILPAAFGIICVRYLVYLLKHTIEAINALNKAKEPG